ncbi:lysM domain-containing GPI-anchored protein 1-like isoform X2 [Solanum tuberosum]|uniref:lysM domain-containing GPI-anchored protein 1-like isoform X2 n=1 Tax=Solanum tuberosum TaxID=4113 RepID=UPI00073A00DB|nr:PREDICTED: lysM domain-containing GPI-anchored protein 1-like isoform X2 [Solanum tuberosum]
MTCKFLVLIYLLILFLVPKCILPKSVIEPCSASDSCLSYLSYRVPWGSKISEIAFRFRINVSDLLVANSIDSNQPNQILSEKSLLKVPISCSCVDGIRRSVSTYYTIGATDTLMSVSEGYGGLVSAEQIGNANGIDEENTLSSGQSVVIPLLCTCFNNSNNGADSVYMSYVVQNEDELTKIATEYSVTIGNLEFINGLGQTQIDPGDILAIPLAACSSANLNWYNESLIVPKGSYALTANNCIKCGCRPTDFSLECLPSGIVEKCSHLQCKDSNIFIGEGHENHTTSGCNVTACIYRGHLGGKIFRSLVNSTDVKCLGKESEGTGSPMESPVKLCDFEDLVHMN